MGWAWAANKIRSIVVAVTSVFGRTGVVTAHTGDYTAAQVTNAADKSSSTTQVFTAKVTSLLLASRGSIITSPGATLTTLTPPTVTATGGWHNTTGVNVLVYYVLTFFSSNHTTHSQVQIRRAKTTAVVNSTLSTVGRMNLPAKLGTLLGTTAPNLQWTLGEFSVPATWRTKAVVTNAAVLGAFVYQA